MESERVGVVDHEVGVPSELAKEEDVLMLLSSIDIRGNPGPTSYIRDVACRLQHLSSPQSEFPLAMEVLPDSYDSVPRKYGISLLPDEMLAAIFDLAIDPLTKWRAADKISGIVKLSHVNRQFRSILLAYPQYWTDVSSILKPETVKLCLLRTRGSPLTVLLNVTCFFSPIEFRFDPALTELILHSNHWKSLIVSYRWVYDDDKGTRRIPLLTSEPWHHTLIDTPLLEELTISQEKEFSGLAHAFDWSNWICPKLRELNLINDFPTHLPGLSQISTLSLRLAIDDEKIYHIFSEISRMQNLQDLALELTSIPYDEDIIVYDPFKISQVRRLRITTTVHFSEKDFSPVLKRSIFSSLFFPGVDNLVVEMKGDNVLGYDAIWDDGYHPNRKFYFNKEINRIFRHINQFPLVESLRLDISSQYSYREDPDLRLEVYIPLNMLPSLKRVELKSNRFFDIKEPEHPDETFYPEEDAVAPRVVGNAFPLLDSATLDMSANPASARWIQDYLHKTKDRRCWHASFQLTIGREDSSGRREESYVGEKALQWCNDLLSKNINEGEYEDDSDEMGREVEE
ncbi:hypothetical protein SCHPADRAFT_993810 [Schizopora paradoxa]|uniref:F-box domain-containing protein n=1 Tax=Schizopora paradoxa TaxID=27342 RepID=A0A0H2S945_9AGAM|nr:hypothetical protein SCHPADRAFT_993810 [Schizopora paradoxa]